MSPFCHFAVKYGVPSFSVLDQFHSSLSVK